MHSQINFGYSWPFTYGHLILTLLALALFTLGWVRKWHKLLLSAIGALTLWAFVAFFLVRFGFDMNGRGTLPTQAFLSAGSGKVLDMGAGTGRSAVMVLEARPQTSLVALDSFGESYEEHFGKAQAGQSVEDQGRQKLLANLRAAGLEQRATIQPGDMRHMPFEPETFDAVVSAYAIDHLSREGGSQALSEAHRVLKPRGEFLLMVIAKDLWLEFTFGPLLMHARSAGPDYWENRLRDAGFEIVESGRRPATHYVLARRMQP
jgi:ubiquinone/menaquinone biosynthesis C-methylase UbiE